MLRQSKLAAKLEGMHQGVGGELVGQRRHRGIVVRRRAQAAAADLAARRVEGAARAARRRQARQLRVAGRAKQARGVTAAQKAAASETPREEIAHRLWLPCGL